jgi:hypothetical protein
MNSIRLEELKRVTNFNDFVEECKGSERTFEREVAELDLDLPANLFGDEQGLTSATAIKICRGLVESIINGKRKEK